MSDRFFAAARAYRRAKRAYERSYEELVEAMVEAADNETVKQVDMVEATDFTREHIRRIVAKVREEREKAKAEGREPHKLTLGGFRES